MSLQVSYSFSSIKNLMPILLFIFPHKSFLDLQLWTINDSKLINKAADLWISSDGFEAVTDKRIYIKDLSRRFCKGVPDNEGYFTLTKIYEYGDNYKEFLTSSQAKKLEIVKGEKDFSCDIVSAPVFQSAAPLLLSKKRSATP